MKQNLNNDSLKILLKKHPKTITTLIILNLIPLLGVIFYGWSGWIISLIIVPLFWLEIVIAGLVNWLHMDNPKVSESHSSRPEHSKSIHTLSLIPRPTKYGLRQYSKSTAALLIANLIPLLGVIFYDWSIGNIVISYWTEIIVIGYFTVQRMKMSKMSEQPDLKLLKFLEKVKSIKQDDDTSAADCKTKESLIKLFIYNYGLFALTIGFFTLIIFSPLMDMKINYLGVLIGAVSFFISHLISHKTNFIEAKEYERVSTQQLIVQPLRLLGVLMFAFTMGVFPLAIFGTPFFVLILFILFKIILDIKRHTKEHQEFSVLT